MRSLVFNDMYKIFAGKKFYVFVIISVAFLLLLSFGVKIVKTMPDATNDPLILHMTGQSFPLVVLDMFVGLLMPVFLFMIIVDLVTEELANGTAKFSLLRPVKRESIIISKGMSVFVLLLLFLVINLCAAYLLGVIALGWGESLNINGVSLSVSEGVFTTIAGYFISVIPLFAFGMVFLVFSLRAASASSGILIGLGLLFILRIIGSMIRPLGPFIITEYFNLYTTLIHTVNWAGLCKGILVSLIYSLAGLLVSIKVFGQKDILY